MARNATEKLVGILPSTDFHQKLFQLITLHGWCHEKKHKPWNYLSLILNLLQNTGNFQTVPNTRTTDKWSHTVKGTEGKDTNVEFDQNDSIKFNTGVYNKHIVCAQFSFISKIIYAISTDILMSFHSFKLLWEES